MKNEIFMKEVEEYCDLLIECSKNDDVSNETMYKFIDKKKRVIELYKKRAKKNSPLKKRALRICTFIIA